MRLFHNFCIFLNTMKHFNIFILLIFLTSCSNDKNTLSNYSNFSKEFNTQKVEYPNKEFSINLPINWEFEVPYIENDKDILGLFASSKPNANGFQNVLLIKKYKGDNGNKDLKSEFNFLLKQIQNHSQITEIVDSGSTTIFNQEAYFFHTKTASENNGNLEIINFLINSNETGVYYNLTASTTQTDRFNIEMANLIHSLKTFKILK